MPARQPVAAPDFRKDPRRLPDGRRIVFYWFDKRPAPGPPAQAVPDLPGGAP